MYKNITEDKILDAIEDYRTAISKKKWILGQMRTRAPAGDDIDNPMAGSPPGGHFPFWKISLLQKQVKIALRNCGYIDPDSIEEYIAKKGYRAFMKALNESTPEIIEIVKASGLRGRGGGGFPTGIKWATCAKHDGERYIICNADEGDPGAYMDRSILEGDPHSVIEGMLIAGWPSDPARASFMCATNTPWRSNAGDRHQTGHESYGLLGDNIAGTDFSVSTSRSPPAPGPLSAANPPL
jgi:NADH:ubiquinone oxidoreductase subunit F (NADH-binding)